MNALLYEMGACSKCSGKYCAQKVSIFASLSEDQLGDISSSVERKSFKKGDPIFFEGDLSDRLIIINKGKIKVFKYTKEGKEQILYILSEGDFIGELSLIKKEQFEFNATALEDTKICTITKQHFDSIMKKHPAIMLKIMEKLHDRVLRLERLVQQLVTKDVEARIACLLLGFIKDFGTETARGVELDMPLNREEMGNYVGITRETMSRKLSALQDSGVIELDGNRRIIIKDKEALENMA